MPDTRPYPSHNAIKVQFGDDSTLSRSERDKFAAKIFGFLDQIKLIPVGSELLDEIEQSKKDLYIKNAGPNVSNQTFAWEAGAFVTLRQCFADGKVVYDVKDELQKALDHSRFKTAKALAKHLTSPLTFVAEKNEWNIEPARVPAYKKQASDFKSFEDVNMTAADMEELLKGILDGTLKRVELKKFTLRGGRGLIDEIIRAFYVPYGGGHPVLTPGSGSNTQIFFNPDTKKSCWFDELKKRPPAIGFVHELIHAWRNLKGLRYFLDKDKTAVGVRGHTPDDEVMTTGFHPYAYEKFSENIFRFFWATASPKEGKLPPRTAY